MKKEIRITDQKRGIVQVTTVDERWYAKEVRNTSTKLPEFKYVPSVTWIAGFYPKGIGFYKWLADKGWDESQAIKVAAGDKGSKVHEAISAILNGQEVRIDSKFINRSRGIEEELTLEEVNCIKSFIDWRNSLEKFEPIAWDMTVYSDKHNYAGSVDLVARINGELYVIDFKTSKEVWTEYEMQVSAYRAAIENGENSLHERNDNGTEGKHINQVANIKMGILQIGYSRNANGYKWNEIEDKFSLFLTAQKIWQNELPQKNKYPGISTKDYPIILSAGKPVEAFEMEDVELTEVKGELPSDDEVELEQVGETTYKPKKKAVKA